MHTTRLWAQTGETALMRAASFGRLDIVEFLVEHGADAKLTNAVSLTLVSESLSNTDDDSSCLDTSIRMAKLHNNLHRTGRIQQHPIIC